MPQITRDLIEKHLAQLVEDKGRQLAELNATLGAMELVRKMLAYMDLPGGGQGDAEDGAASKVEDRPACGTKTGRRSSRKAKTTS